MIVHVGYIFLANKPAKKFLEWDICSLPCSRIHMNT